MSSDTKIKRRSQESHERSDFIDALRELIGLPPIGIANGAAATRTIVGPRTYERLQLQVRIKRLQ